ncbi:unnamed protein product [Ranitomeya imitator]|uniref:Uncharacterized protein n=1 Tax=Ranitomeya imitator TaxID=111125 RepID=A0ABN9MTC2_9NEOB|nr:unnamed protein product [Ranitomeya imitator]
MFTLVTSEDIAESASHTPIQRCQRESQRRNKVLAFLPQPAISQQGPNRCCLSHWTISLARTLQRHGSLAISSRVTGEPGLKGEDGHKGDDGEAVQQLREALKILAERVLILEHMIGIHDTLSFVEPGSGQDILGSITSKNLKQKSEQQQKYQTLDIFSSLLDDSESSQN